VAAATVSLDLREIDGAKNALASAALDGAGREALLRGIGAEMEAQTRERFDTRRSPEGDAWKALAQKTRDYYAENGLGHRSLLVGSGALRDSVRSEVEGGAWSALVGATMEYAAVHQFGATIRPRAAKALAVPGYGTLRKATIPARPYLGVSAGDASDIAALASAFLAGRVA